MIILVCALYLPPEVRTALRNGLHCSVNPSFCVGRPILLVRKGINALHSSQLDCVRFVVPSAEEHVHISIEFYHLFRCIRVTRPRTAAGIELRLGFRSNETNQFWVNDVRWVDLFFSNIQSGAQVRINATHRRSGSHNKTVQQRRSQDAVGTTTCEPRTTKQ